MGELQFVLGPSGSGKTEYIDRRIIKESIDEPGTNYLFLVPEQSSLAIQTKLVKLHPNGGFFNIEVFGFNRLAYTVFDELNVRTSSVLDDYGKSMLLRSLAGKLKDRLVYYQNSLDKNGFIDQLKSFMSELYQYDISRAELREAVDKLQASHGNDALINKLKDMLVIFEEFDDYMKDNAMIVAEQTTELLVKKIGQSRRLENTVVIMDGFTGFTPIQLNVIRELMAKVKKIYAVVTIDRESYFKRHMKNHELFYLSRKTISSLGRLADETHTIISDEIWPEDFGEEIHSRWGSAELVHLEQNIFRYPYKRYTGTDLQDVNISCFATSADEIHSVAATIRYMVNMEGYRYKDIAVVSGNLEKTAELTDRIFPQYGIVYFNDYNQKLKSNAVIDGILALFDLLERNMNYESVFAFLKSGVIPEEIISYENVDRLENYVLKHGIHGYSQWKHAWPDSDMEENRNQIMDILEPLFLLRSSKKPVRTYVTALRSLDRDGRLGLRSRLGDRIYDALGLIYDKLESIIGEEKTGIHEFKELLELGLKELELGVVPSKIDMTVVGDITRTRLSDVKVLFIVGANVGVIPKVNNRRQIISDVEKDKLVECGLELAPGDIENDYLEQFYLYLNLSKPSQKLYISYACGSGDKEGGNEPSYIIGRLRNIYPHLNVNNGTYKIMDINGPMVSNENRNYVIASLIARLREGDEGVKGQLMALIKYCRDNGDTDTVDRLKDAMIYSNISGNLDKEVIEEIKDKLLEQSVTKLETYANCAYSYYLRYVLMLKEREVKEISSLNFGKILHTSLKNIYVSLANRSEAHLKNFKWGDKSTIEYKETDGFKSGFDRLIYEAVDKAYIELYEGFRNDAKYEFMKSNIVRVATKAIGNLFEKQDSGSLVPSYFELPYTRKLMVDGISKDEMKITGSIDRVDIEKYKNDEGKLCEKVRVMDYKTGSTKFDIKEVYDGLQLQLVMYLSAIVEKELAKGNAGNVEPEGAYYYGISDRWEKDKKTKEKEYEPDGIAASDEVYDGQIESVMKYVDKKIVELEKSLLQGDISKYPIQAEQDKMQCVYCPYKANCRFDVSDGGNEVKKRSYAGNSAAVRKEIVVAMGQEVDS